MKITTIKIVFLIILISNSTFGQNKIETSASEQAQEMISFYNNRDIEKYVDYLLPVYYGNEDKYKENLTNVWKKILKQDSAKFKFVEVLKLTKSGNQNQVLFHVNFRDNKDYIIGISDDNGNNWKFTTIFTKVMKFNQLVEKIPTLDHSFMETIDPKFGERIDYKIGETISPFKFNDINGNEISSKSLKGKIIILNFWGTWCAPCVKEIPELNKLVKKYNDKDLKFIAPAITTTKESLKNSFLPKHPFSYDIVLIDGDDYVISSYPTHVIINQNQQVVEIITGYSEENIKRLEQTINKTL